jgi:hypothetical protein
MHDRLDVSSQYRSVDAEDALGIVHVRTIYDADMVQNIPEMCLVRNVPVVQAITKCSYSAVA